LDLACFAEMPSLRPISVQEQHPEMQHVAALMGQKINDHLNTQPLFDNSFEVWAREMVVDFQFARQALVCETVLRHELVSDPSSKSRRI
jgi:hypothetical protein